MVEKLVEDDPERIKLVRQVLGRDITFHDYGGPTWHYTRKERESNGSWGADYLMENGPLNVADGGLAPDRTDNSVRYQQGHVTIACSVVRDDRLSVVEQPVRGRMQKVIDAILVAIGARRQERPFRSHLFD